MGKRLFDFGIEAVGPTEAYGQVSGLVVFMTFGGYLEPGRGYLAAVACVESKMLRFPFIKGNATHYLKPSMTVLAYQEVGRADVL